MRTISCLYKGWLPWTWSDPQGTLLRMVGCVIQKFTVISIGLSGLRSRWFWPKWWISQSTSHLCADSSMSWIKPVTVVSPANFRSPVSAAVRKEDWKDNTPLAFGVPVLTVFMWKLTVTGVWFNSVEGWAVSTNRILANVPEWSRWCRMKLSPKLTAAPADLFAQVSKQTAGVLQTLQHHSLKECHYHRHQSNRPIVI